MQLKHGILSNSLLVIKPSVRHKILTHLYFTSLTFSRSISDQLHLPGSELTILLANHKPSTLVILHPSNIFVIMINSFCIVIITNGIDLPNGLHDTILAENQAHRAKEALLKLLPCLLKLDERGRITVTSIPILVLLPNYHCNRMMTHPLQSHICSCRTRIPHGAPTFLCSPCH